MAGRTSRPLLVAGVAGGVGTSTWVRAMRQLVALPILDVGVYPSDEDSGSTSRARRGPVVDILVTANTAASTAPVRLGRALAACPRPPILVVMHTVPGSIGTARAHLRTAKPHIARQINIAHQQVWLEMDEAPGKYLPKGFAEIVRSLPATLQQMYSKHQLRSVPALPPEPPQFRPAGATGLNTNHGSDRAHGQWPPGGPVPLSPIGQR